MWYRVFVAFFLLGISQVSQAGDWIITNHSKEGQKVAQKVAVIKWVSNPEDEANVLPAISRIIVKTSQNSTIMNLKVEKFQLFKEKVTKKGGKFKSLSEADSEVLKVRVSTLSEWKSLVAFLREFEPRIPEEILKMSFPYDGEDFFFSAPAETTC